MGGTFDVKSNEEQLQVIRTTESPLLVIAGPGAGKTKTLVDRVCHLIYDLNVSPENILIGTFTEKAAKELLSRISTVSDNYKVQKNISEIRVGTLHSLFLDFLEEYREYTDLRRGYRVLDDFEQQYLVYRSASKFNQVEGLAEILESESAYGWKSAKKICYLVNKVAEENLDLEKLAQCKESNRLLALAQLVSVYRKILFEENALDFSLIQTKMWELLDNQEVLKDIRKKIHYIMVDEYQDTNRIQEQILLKMAAPDNRICVVGDVRLSKIFCVFETNSQVFSEASVKKSRWIRIIVLTQTSSISTTNGWNVRMMASGANFVTIRWLSVLASRIERILHT